jgi:hypothetical protein
MSSTWVKPSAVTWATRRGASSCQVIQRSSSSGTRIHDPRCTSYTLMGDCRALKRVRASIHASSRQTWWVGAGTTARALGRISVCRATGSILRCHPPSAAITSYW